MADFEPRPFGKYFLTEKIAVGGMAEIYRAKVFGVDGFEKTLAIKKILPHFSSDKEFISMLTNEAKLVVQLSHPNIVQVYDLGRVREDYFISMEYIHGVNLRQFLTKSLEIGKPVPIEIGLHIISEVLKGLEYAHSKRGGNGTSLNIIHRDVSPHNILVSYEGEVKLVDFGIARAAQTISHTQLGILKGKVTYMSPEQALGKPLDQRSDIYSAGIILFEMLTGQRLYSGETQLEVLEQVRNTRVTYESLDSDIPEVIRKIIAKALAYNVKERYQTAADMQVEIMKVIYSEFGSFTPKKLSDIMYNWFSKEKPEVSVSKRILKKFQTESVQLPRNDQINLVHRESSLSKNVKQDQFEGKSSRAEEETFVQNPKDDDRTEPAVIPSYKSIKYRFLWEKYKKYFYVIFGVIGFMIFLLIGKGVYNSFQPEFGSIKIYSQPSGALIYLDKVNTGGVTPASLNDLQVNEVYELVLEKKGYKPYKKVILVENSEERSIHIRLQKSQRDFYLVSLRSEPSGAKIFLDGKDTGRRTPSDISQLRVKKNYELILKKQGFKDFKVKLQSEKSRDQILDVNLVKEEQGF